MGRKEYFYHVLTHPAEMPKDLEFEAILYLAKKAYTLKNENTDFNFAPSVSYETYSNVLAWNNNKQNYISGLITS